MVESSEVLSVSAFLSSRQLSIPTFQRPYKWTVRHVVQLMADIQLFAPNVSYRIGTIVIHKNNGAYDIVDGQQRTITFFLLLQAIVAGQHAGLVDHQLRDSLGRFEISNDDISTQNIRRNYQEILRRSSQLDAAFIHHFLYCCEVTVFVLQDISEAFQFFDSQNARGKDLAPHDLLKAFHLREMEGVPEAAIHLLIADWEKIPSNELSTLFAAYLYRVRGWIKGHSSREYTKEDVGLFKGIPLQKAQQYPYGEIYQIADNYVREDIGRSFPFQLDQPILNGRYFFQMVSYYRDLCRNVVGSSFVCSDQARTIMDKINSYEGRWRKGDQHVRMLFDCGLLYYMDRFGQEGLSKAIEKIFIWAYTPRLVNQSVSIATVDNYVLNEFNLFKAIQEAVTREDVHLVELDLLTDRGDETKAPAIKALFKSMQYYV